MAIVLVEEVLLGLDEVKGSIEQALAVVDGIIEELHPDLGAQLEATLTTSLRQPLQSRLSALETLIESLAA